MKFITFIVLLNITAVNGFCQNTLPTVLRQGEVLTPFYELIPAGCKVLYLPMEYAGSTFSFGQQDAAGKLKNATVMRIDLVYSDYPAKADFSALTERRLKALHQALPSVFSDTTIEFRKIRQTSGSSRELASALQHGFFIYFRPLATKGSGKKEVSKLTALLAKSIEESTPGSVDTVGFYWLPTRAFPLRRATGR
jgi:hypothetical protein